jgi:hypothetical protein
MGTRGAFGVAFTVATAGWLLSAPLFAGDLLLLLLLSSSSLSARRA